MAKSLLNLTTDLKSQKYQGWNGSEPPLVTKDINNPPSNSRVAQEVNSRVDDVVRVTKSILPTNSRFLENQAKLRQFGSEFKLNRPIREIGQDLIQRVKTTAVDLVKTSASTIAQTAVAGTGARIGIGFTRVNSQAALQGNIITAPEELTKGKNRRNIPENQVGANTLRQVIPLSEEVTSPYTDTKTYIQTESSLRGVSETGRLIRQVQRGDLIEIPNEDRLTVSKLKDKKPSEELKDSSLFTDTLSSNQFNKDENTEQRSGTSIKLFDFVAKKRNKTDRYSKADFNKELRVGLGDQGIKPRDPLNYSITNGDSIDKVNALDIIETGASTESLAQGRDLIKLRFEIITPENSRTLFFRAYLNDFSDGFRGNWSETRYIGRGEAMQTYDGFSRDISLSFKIAASTRREMEPLYRKMVYLASSTAPTYGTDQNFMRGTFARVTVGSYLYEVPGVITSVDYKWQVDYPWEIAFQNPESGTDDDMQELPHIMDCSLSFRPIHDFIPQTGLQHYITNPRPANKAKEFLTAPIGTSYID